MTEYVSREAFGAFALKNRNSASDPSDVNGIDTSDGWGHLGKKHSASAKPFNGNLQCSKIDDGILIQNYACDRGIILVLLLAKPWG